MSVSEIKASVLDKINKLNSDKALEEINKMLDMYVEEDREVYGLSADHLNAINEGIEDIKKGNYKSNEEVKSYFEEWLKK